MADKVLVAIPRYAGANVRYFVYNDGEPFNQAVDHVSDGIELGRLLQCAPGVLQLWGRELSGPGNVNAEARPYDGFRTIDVADLARNFDFALETYNVEDHGN